MTNDLRGSGHSLAWAADLRFCVELRGFCPLTPRCELAPGRGPPAAITAGLVILALTAAKARAIGHAASTAFHVAIVTAITLAIAAIPVTAAIVAIRRCRARGRATAALPAAQQSREIPLAHVRALPPATPRPRTRPDVTARRA